VGGGGTSPRYAGLSMTIALYPNPARDNLVITSNLTEPFSYWIYDLPGREVLKPRKFTGNTEVDVSCIGDGLYFIHFESRGQRTVRKFVVQ